MSVIPKCLFLILAFHVVLSFPTHYKLISLFGRTGAGKSSLGNRLLGNSEVFREGNGLRAETNISEAAQVGWQLDPEISLTVLDNPGYGDNRPEFNATEFTAEAIKALSSLNGLNLALFCLPVSTPRPDRKDIDEIKLLIYLLGEEVLDHLYIVLTHVNTLSPRYKQKKIDVYKEQLPALLEENGIKGITQDKILVADFDTIDDDFLPAVDKLIKVKPAYKPKIIQDLDIYDPKSIQKLLETKEMQRFLDLKGGMLEKFIDKLFDDGNFELELAMKLKSQKKDLQDTNSLSQKIFNYMKENIFLKLFKVGTVAAVTYLNPIAGIATALGMAVLSYADL